MNEARFFRRSVALVYLAAVLQGAFGLMIPASSALLRHRLAMGDALYGALFLPALLLAMVTSLLGHALLRRWSLKALFLYGLGSEIVVLLLIGLAGIVGRPFGLPVLILSQILQGPAMGTIGITVNTAAIELFPRARHGALSALHGLLGAGAAIWPMVVAAAIGLHRWAAAPFLLAGCFAVTLILGIVRPIHGLAESPHDGEAWGGTPSRLFTRSMTALVYGVCEATLTVWAVVYLYEKLRLPMGIAAGALSAFWVAMTAGRLVAAAVVRRVPAVGLALALILGMAVSFLVVGRAHDSAGAIFAFGLAGLSCSAVFPLLLSLASAEFTERTPQVSAVFTAAVLTGLAIGSFGVGPLRPLLGLARIYELTAILPVILAILVLRLGHGEPGR